MKKRIISCLLVLIMIISALSFTDCHNVTSSYAASKNSHSYYIKGGRIYNKQDQIVKNKIVTINKKKYYASKKGNVVKNKLFKYSNGKSYFAQRKGALAQSQFVQFKGKRYYAQKKGAIVKKSFFKVKGKKYYADKTGSIYKNKLFTVNNKMYYSQKDYSIAINKKVTVKGKEYIADKNGVLTPVKDKDNSEQTTTEKDTQSTTEKKQTTEKKTTETTSEDDGTQKTTDGSKKKADDSENQKQKSTEDPSKDNLDSNVNKDDLDGYITPQDCGAVGDGLADDTKAFRKMFYEAIRISKGNGYYANPKPKDGNPGSTHAKAIYIPAGTYKITGPILDYKDMIEGQSSKIRYVRFEVSGAGRESTKIVFTGDVLFDNQIPRGIETNDGIDNRPIFQFSTFRDISFEGNNTNTFMNMSDIINGGANDGPQRYQYFNCSFKGWNKIFYCIKGTIMLSEMTFSNCKIYECGTESNKCTLFTCDNPQAVNWRFVNTDIEKFNGDAFYYLQGTAVSFVGGSIAPSSGNVVNTAVSDDDRGQVGPGNSPQFACNGTRIKTGKDCALVRKDPYSQDSFKVRFKGCYLSTNTSVSDRFLDINGKIDVLFEDCYECDDIRIDGDVAVTKRYKDGAFIKPTVKFINCHDLNVDNLVTHSKVNNYNDKTEDRNNVESLMQNNCHVTIDNTYDFYIRDKQHIETLTGLQECRQPIKDASVKPFGYVKFLEISVPKSSRTSGKTATVTLYDRSNGSSTQIGEPVKISLDSEEPYRISVYKDVKEIQAVITNANFGNPYNTIDMELVKY